MAQIGTIAAICERFAIPLIEDAAESLGATFEGKHSGTFGRFGVYSFNGNKILTTSGGGFLISPDAAAIERARFLSTQAKDDFPHYEHTTYGYNYRMSNILAGVGIAQLEVLEARIAKKREIFDAYRTALETVDDIRFMPEIAGSVGNRWLTTVTFESFERKEAVRLALEKADIESRPLWKPMHLQPVFHDCAHITNGVSETLFEKGLCLPSGTAMREEEMEKIVAVIKNVL
jgi:dTDP-4-amino-4,6-dideoxygalactose transaminase